MELMGTAISYTSSHIHDQEIVDILIDSDLYLDLDLRERFMLIRYLAECLYKGAPH